MSSPAEDSVEVPPKRAPGGPPIRVLIFASAACLLILSLLMARNAALRERIPPIPVMGSVGEFTLVDSEGKERQAQELAGKVWIASFIFTSCGGPCPQVSGVVSSLQSDPALRGVSLVSFSVDPKTDRPAVFKTYAQNYKADPARWMFLTGRDGKELEIVKFIVSRFKVPVVRAPEGVAAKGMEIAHSTRLALVDKRGQIRGYYLCIKDEKGNAPFGSHTLRELRRDAARLMRESYP